MEVMIQMTSFMCQPQWTVRMNFYLTDTKREYEFLHGNQRDLPFLVKRDHVSAVFMLDGRNDLHSVEIPLYNDYVKW